MQRSRWGGAAARRAAWRGLPVGGNLMRAARSPGDAPACPGAQRAPRLLCLGPRRSRRRRIEKGRCSSRMRPGNGRCWRAERPAVRRPGVQLDFARQPRSPKGVSRQHQQRYQGYPSSPTPAAMRVAAPQCARATLYSMCCQACYSQRQDSRTASGSSPRHRPTLPPQQRRPERSGACGVTGGAVRSLVAEECSREFRALPVARLEGSPPPHFWRRNAVHPQRCRLLRTPLELAGESSGLTMKSTPACRRRRHSMVVWTVLRQQQGTVTKGVGHCARSLGIGMNLALHGYWVDGG